MALILSVLGCAVLAVPQLWLGWLQAPPEVEALVTQYLRVLSLGLPGSLLFRAIYALNTAVSRPRVVMALQLVGLGLKVLLSYALIYGALGLPRSARSARPLASVLVFWTLFVMGARLHAARSVLSPLLHPLGGPALAHPARAVRARHPHEPLLHAGGDVLHRDHAPGRAARDDGDGRASGGGQHGRGLLHDPAVARPSPPPPSPPSPSARATGARARHTAFTGMRMGAIVAAVTVAVMWTPAGRHRAALHERPRGGGDGLHADPVSSPPFTSSTRSRRWPPSSCARTRSRWRPTVVHAVRPLGHRRVRRLSGGLSRRLGPVLGDLGHVDDAGHRAGAGRVAPRHLLASALPPLRAAVALPALARCQPPPSAL